MKNPRRLFRSRRQDRNLFEHYGNKGFDFGDNSTIHAAWAIPCGTGNLLGVIWQDQGGPVKGRIRYENEGRKQVLGIPMKPTLDETIRYSRTAVTACAALMEQVCATQFSLYEKIGPLTTKELVTWLVDTGAFRLLGDGQCDIVTAPAD